MAKTKLFKTRKVRAQAATERRVGKREPYDIVLIVCEGAKTEPNYLNGLKSDLGLSNANIKILDEDHGSDPLSVVNFAIEYYQGDPIYDRIYCVFDKDGHSTYQPALDLIRSDPLKQKEKLFAINSVPCFEIWLLLHYGYSTKAYKKAGNQSPCDLVIKDLKAKIPDYAKHYRGIYETVSDKTEAAIKHAKQLAKHNNQVDSDNPSTLLYDLVEYLKGLKEKRGTLAQQKYPAK